MNSAACDAEADDSTARQTSKSDRDTLCYALIAQDNGAQQLRRRQYGAADQQI
jgi:hypothetical protein